jgi:RNA polymerase sigma factor (sigma-70 family)
MKELESQIQIATKKRERATAISVDAYRKSNFDSIPVLTSDEEVGIAKTFSTLEFSRFLLGDVKTGTPQKERLLTPPGKDQKNPVLAKEIAETVLEKIGLTQNVDLIYATNESLKTKQQLTEKEKIARTTTIGYSWKKEVNNSDKDQIVEQLEEQVHKATDAREKLIKHNLRWGIDMANRFPTRSIPVDDRIQLSFLGIMRAAEKFDWRSGYKFSTYSKFWIHKEMQEAVYTQSRTIRLSKNTEIAIAKLKQNAELLQAQNNKKPSIQELQELVKEQQPELSASMIAMAADIYTSKKLDTLSLDESDDTQDKPSIASSLKAPHDTEQRVLDSLKNEKLYAAVSQLSDREQQIIFMRYVEDKSYQQIAKAHGLSHTRIQQIEKEAREKLRNNPLVKQIENMVE